MKVAFVGKGGSGKTTLAALFARYLAESGLPVLALDADINQNLATALGVPPRGTPAPGTPSPGTPDNEAPHWPTLADHLDEIKEYLRGDNPRIASAAAMVKTTPPGRGSRLLRVVEENPVYRACLREIDGVRLAVTGGFAESDLGVACYHSKVGAVELLLNHLVDGPGEYVVVDMTAGADAFASGLFTRFDATVVVCEPTVRAIGVYRQYADHARDFGVATSVVGNKVADGADEAFLREHVGTDLVTHLGVSRHVKAAEQGHPRPIRELEPENRAALATLLSRVDGLTRDWAEYTRLAHEFHRRNAHAWANARLGHDLTEQIDPEFVLHPATLTASIH